MIKCSNCGKKITDGNDEENCIECRAILCLKCYNLEFMCKDCEKEWEYE